jgi:hypothetical protein
MVSAGGIFELIAWSESDARLSIYAIAQMLREPEGRRGNRASVRARERAVNRAVVRETRRVKRRSRRS